MSKEVDYRVVEMQFDNKKFEKNAQESMSTLDKLKKSLDFKGASKNLKNFSKEAKRCDMSPMAKGIEMAGRKFSALEVMGVTALANITNSAVNAGKAMVKALTIEPVKTGFDEYELKMDSIKTIMASTGESIDSVNGYLDELNKYSDRTIYKFSDMTQNIGKFTNAGVGLEDAVLAMKGISNEAALSGANAVEASRAMYNLSQAMSMGYMQYIDWKSIENANMATLEFKENLINTAKEFGTLSDEAVDAYGGIQAAFKDGLKDGWLTNEVLLETLKEYADETTELGQRAYAAAQDITKFTQLFDVLKEAAQSGWTESWQKIIGDFDEAKEFFGQMSKIFQTLIDKSAEKRNSLLGGALSSQITKYNEIKKIIADTGLDMSNFEDVVAGMAKSYGVDVDRMVADSGSFAQAIKDNNFLTSDMIKDTIISISAYAKECSSMTDEQLKEMGVTREQVIALTELADQADTTGTSLFNMVSGMDLMDGRVKLLQSLCNIIEAIGLTLKPIKDAWYAVFPPETPEHLYGIVDGLNKFTESLKPSEAMMKRIEKTFRGLFSILKPVVVLAKTGLNVVFKACNKTLDIFANLLSYLTAPIGDIIYYFQQWTFETSYLANGLRTAYGYIKITVGYFKLLLNYLYNLPIVQNNIERFSKAFSETYENLKTFLSVCKTKLDEFFESLKNLDEVSFDDFKKTVKDFNKNVIDFFINGIGGVFENLGKAFKDFGADAKVVFTTVGDECKSFGNYIGRSLGYVKDKLVDFWNAFRSLFTKDIGLGEILVVVLSIGIMKTLIRFADTLYGLVDTFEDIGDGMARSLRSLAKTFDAMKFEKRANGIAAILKSLSIAIAVLAGSVYLLSGIDAKTLWSTVGALAVLSGVLLGLSILVSKMKDIKGFSVVTTSILGMSAAVFILASALKKMDSLDGEQLTKNIAVLGGMIVGLGIFIKVMQKLSGDMAGTSTILADNSKKFSKNAGHLLRDSIYVLSLAVSFKILVSTLDDIAKISVGGIAKSAVVLYGAIVSLKAVANVCATIRPKAFMSIVALPITLKLLASAMNSIANLDAKKIMYNIGALIEVLGTFAVLMLATRLAGGNAAKAGAGAIGLATSLLIIVKAIKSIADIDKQTLADATKSIYSILKVFAAVMVLSNFAGKNAAKAGVMMILMSVSIGLLAGVIALLSMLKPKGLASAVAAIVVIGVVFRALIKVTENAGKFKGIKGTLITLTVALGLMAAAIGILSAINPAGLATAAISLGLVVGMFALLVKATASAKAATVTLLVLTGIVGVLGLILIKMAQLPIGQSLAAAASLSLLLLTMSATLAIMGSIGIIALAGVPALAAITAVIFVLAKILVAMGELPVEQSIGVAKALSILLLAMSAALIPMGAIGILALAGIPALVCLIIIVKKLGDILTSLSDLPVEQSIGVAKALSILLLGMSAALIPLGTAGVLAPLAIAGAGALILIVGALGVLMTKIGELATHYPQLEEFLDKGLTLLARIGKGIGEFFGSIVAGFVGAASSGLILVGANLSLFMMAIQPFLQGAKQIGPESMDGVKALAETILLLTGVELLNGVASFLTGGSPLIKFAAQMIPFGIAIKQFSKEVEDIDEGAVKAAANAGKVLAEMAKTLPNSGGVVGWWSGENELGDFAKQLIPFGKNMKLFSEAVTGLNKGVVENAAAAGSAIAEMITKLPNTGGFAAEWFGDNTLSRFAMELVPFGVAIRAFSMVVTGLDKGVVENAASAGGAIAEMIGKLPNNGGLARVWYGDNTLSRFAAELVPFGASMKLFSIAVSGMNAGDVKTAASAGGAIAEMIGKLPNNGGLAAVWYGDNTLSRFAHELALFGSSFKIYAKCVENISPSAVKASATAASTIAELAKNLPSRSTFKNDFTLPEFGKELEEFGEQFAKYCKKISKIDIYELPNISYMIWSLGDAIGGLNVDALNTLSDTLTSLGELSTQGLAKSFSDAIPSANAAIQMLILAMVRAINNNADSIVKAFNKIITDSISKIDSRKPDFYKAGENLVSDLSRGIKSKASAAIEEARQLSNKLSDAINGATRSRSYIGGSELLPAPESHTASPMAASMSAPMAPEANQNGTMTPNIPVKEGPKPTPTGGNNNGGGVSKYFPRANEWLGKGFDSMTQTAKEKIKEGVAETTATATKETTTSGKKVSKSAGKASNQVTTEAKKPFEAFKDWLDEQKFYSKLTAEEELEEWKKQQAKYKAGSEERKEIDREVYTLERDIREKTLEEDEYYGKINLQDKLNWQKEELSRYKKGTEEYKQRARDVYDTEKEIRERTLEDEEYYGKITLEQKKKRLQEELKMYKAGSDAYREYEEKIRDVDAEINDKSLEFIKAQMTFGLYGAEEIDAGFKRILARTEEGTEEYKRIMDAWREYKNTNSTDWLERQELEGKLTPVSELAGYRRIMKETEKGAKNENADYWKDAQKGAQSAAKKIFDSFEQLQDKKKQLREDEKRQRDEIDQAWIDKQKELNDKLESDIKELEQNYKDALNSRTDALYSAYGLFDKVGKSGPVSGKVLMKNLQGQVDAFEDWQKEINKLTENRSLDKYMVEELRAMGPDAIGEIKALNKMSDSELAQYANIWSEKHKLAKDQATFELKSMRISTDREISQLKSDTQAALDDYRINVWAESLHKLSEETNKKAEQLTEDFLTEVGVLPDETKATFETTITVVKDVLGMANWNEDGQYIVDGIIEGINSKLPDLKKKIDELSTLMPTRAESNLEINSPSKVFARIGMFTIEGLILGLKSKADEAGTTVKEISSNITDYVNETISRIRDRVNSGANLTPTIRPVIDLSNVNRGLDYMNGTILADRSFALAARMSNQNGLRNQEDIASIIAKSNNNISDTIKGLRNDFSDLVDKVTQLKVVMDSGALVGEIAPDMDNALGDLAKLSRRGVR